MINTKLQTLAIMTLRGHGMGHHGTSWDKGLERSQELRTSHGEIFINHPRLIWVNYNDLTKTSP